jgi:anti-sigma factor RsiW
MTCRDLIELLIDFVSDELPAHHRAAVQQHLLCCPPCEAYLESYRLTIQLTRRLPCAPMPPELERRLRAALSDITREKAD